MDLRMQTGFLGTGASLLADLTLLAYILLIVPAMIVGFVFARRKMFVPYHKLTMTGITLLNWLLAGFFMAVSYAQGVAPNVPQGLSQPVYLLPTIHLITGGIAQAIATYLVLRMWLENVLPKALLIRNIKLFMRTTLILWFITAGLGISIYLTWYSAGSALADTGTPVATPEVTPETTPSATEDAVVPPAQTPESDSGDDVQIAPPVATERVDDSDLRPVETPDSDDEGNDSDDDRPIQTPEMDEDNSGSGSSNSGSGNSGSGSGNSGSGSGNSGSGSGNSGSGSGNSGSGSGNSGSGGG